MSKPKAALEKIGAPLGVGIDSLEFAELMDKQDVLAETRELFVIPKLGTIPCGQFNLGSELMNYLDVVESL